MKSSLILGFITLIAVLLQLSNARTFMNKGPRQGVITQELIMQNAAAPTPVLNPQFFVFGFPKAGTTTLYAYTIQSSEISMYHKELNWWVNNQEILHYNVLPFNITKHYFTKFIPLDRGVSGDFTILSCYCRPVAKNLASLIPNIKVMAIVREPVSRARSHYKMCMRSDVRHRMIREKVSDFNVYVDINLARIQECKDENPSKDGMWLYYKCFLEQKYLCKWFNKDIIGPGCNHIIEGSMYIYPVQTWKGYFGNNLLLLTSDEMKEDPTEMMAKVFNFIGVKPLTIEPVDANKAPDKQKTITDEHQHSMDLLTSFYAPYTHEFLDFTGLKTNWLDGIVIEQNNNRASDLQFL